MPRKSQKEVKINPERIYEIEKEVKHDVIAFCSSVTEQINDDQARFFHYGVTSSDVIDTSINLMIKDSLMIIQNDFLKMLKSLFIFSEQNKLTPCMGRSHGINAEPLSLGVKFLAIIVSSQDDLWILKNSSLMILHFSAQALWVIIQFLTRVLKKKWVIS